MYSGSSFKLPDDFAGKRLVLRNYRYKIASGGSYEDPSTATGYFCLELLANGATVASTNVSMLRTYVNSATPTYGMYTFACLPYITATAPSDWATWDLPRMGALNMSVKLFNMPHGQATAGDYVGFEFLQLWFDVVAE